MATQLRSFGRVELDLAAAAQQLALIQATYALDVEPIKPLLLPDGVIVHQELDNNTWPPSHLLIKAGENDYVLALGGTTSATGQLAWHVWGTFSYSTQGGAVLNGQWGRVYEPIVERCLAIGGGNDVRCRFRISGHSYGGAVGQLVADTLRILRPNWEVELITFGSPRARGRGFTGPIAEPYWRLESSADPVPQLPPSGLYPYGFLPIQLIGLVFRHVDWEHYGSQRIIWPDGTVGQAGATPTPLPPGVDTTHVGSHYPRNYAARLAANYRAHGGPPEMAHALEILGQQVERGFAQNIVPGLPMTIPAADGTPVVNPVPFAPIVEPRRLRGNVMAEPTYLNGGTVFNVAFLFNAGETAGWSEQLRIYFSAEGLGIDTIRDKIVQLAEERRSLLTSTCKLWGVRISRDNPRGKSRLFTKAPWGTGKGTAGGIHVNPGNCFLFDIIDVSEQFKARMTLRGLPVDSATIQAINDRYSELPPGRLVTWANKVRTWLAGQNQIFPLGFQGVIKVTDKRQDLFGGDVPVFQYGLENCRLWLDVVGGIQDVKIGDWVVLSHKKQDCITGLTGEARVINLVPGGPNGTTRYHLDRGYCCPVETLAKAVGKVRKRAYAYVAIGNVEYNCLSFRKPGRPFGSVPGKQKGACC